MAKNIDCFIDRTDSNAEKYTLRQELFGIEDLIPMWVADMDLATPPFILEAIHQRLKHPILGYEEFNKIAKKAQIDWLKIHHNLDFDIDQMIYSPSVVTSINLIIQALTTEEDEIIVQPPVYFPFFKSVQNNNRKVVKNRLIYNNGLYRIDFEHLESVITTKTKLLLLCSPHNPVGRVWSLDELSKLYHICKKHNIIIFEDAIHSDLVYKPNKFYSILQVDPKAKDITISAFGIGKTFNCAGINLSTLYIQNESLRQIVKNHMNKIHLAQPNIVSSVAFETAYRQGSLWLQELLRHLENNMDYLYNCLKPYNHLICFQKPQGTYLVWLDCNKMGLSNKQLRDFFIHQAKLGLNAGISFGKEGSGYMRINLAVDSKTLQKACQQLTKALKKFKA